MGGALGGAISWQAMQQPCSVMRVSPKKGTTSNPICTVVISGCVPRVTYSWWVLQAHLA